MPNWTRAKTSTLTCRQAHTKYGSIRAAARAMDIPFTTFYERLQREIALEQEGLEALTEWTGARAQPAAAVEAETPPARIALEMRTLRETLAAKDQELQSLYRLTRSAIPITEWHQQAPSTASTSLIPVLFTSDMHCGEVIDADEVDGLNEYNLEIFRSRYQLMIEKTIEISRKHMGPATYPGLIYLRGGDAISGNIHEEIREGNQLDAIPAVRECFMQERAGLKRLLDEFGKVHVISVPGNHGRDTIKPRHAGYANRNYETMLAWWLRSAFDGDPRITFHEPASGDAYFSVFGWNVLLNHGDRMGSRGGMGFVGPAATIARGHWKLYDNWTRTGHPVSYILTGHLHTSLKLERGYANGSLAGFGPFARDMRAIPDAPRQWLLYFHPELGICDARELVLGNHPRRLVAGMVDWSTTASQGT